ncbi:DNA replication regulator SLD3-domain-containing protein [Dipodascopsis tothii]|uniref:DNA replication regulator SLD3-domain-containing protein n=1 Tax=Dipodascopsis tothii TaxID=44089 RepID=UPI0034CDA3D3
MAAGAITMENAPVTPGRRRPEQPAYMAKFTISPFSNTALVAPITVTPLGAIGRRAALTLLTPEQTVQTPSRSRTRPSRAMRAGPRPVRIRLPGLDGKVLVARIEEEKSLCVLEHAGPDLYMMTTLDDHVKAKQVRALIKRPARRALATTPGKQQLATPGKALMTPAKATPGKVAVPPSPPPPPADYGQLTLGFEPFWAPLLETDRPAADTAAGVFCMFPPGYEPSAEPASPTAPGEPDSAPRVCEDTDEDEAAPDDGDDGLAAQLSADALVRHMQTTYFETLYGLKIPLAVFAKSKLVRFAVLCNNDAQVIADTLERLVASVNETEYKYKQWLDQVLDEIAAHRLRQAQPGAADPADVSLFEPAVSMAGSTVGLTAVDLERQHIFRWATSDMNLGDARSRRAKIAELKTRETYLQIIILLEVLAQRRLLHKDDSPKKSKKRKADGPIGHELQLHILFDRLYIWQTVASAMSLDSPSTSRPEEPPDAVREFCMEVVVPFYGARLPKVTRGLVKKCASAINGVSPRRKKPRPPTTPTARRPSTLSEEVSAAAASRSLSLMSPTLTRSSSMTAAPAQRAPTFDIFADRRLTNRMIFRGGLTTTTQDLQKRQVDIARIPVSRQNSFRHK